MDEKKPVNPEITKLQRRLELLTQKLESLEGILARLAPAAQAPAVTVRFSGVWRQAGQRADANGPEPIRSSVKRYLSYRDSTVLRPYPGHACLSLASLPVTISGFVVMGFDPASLALAVDQIAKIQREKLDFIPVFITDSVDFGSFRKHGYVLEFIPSPQMSATISGTSSLSDRMTFRLAEIKEKWGIQEMFDLSPGKLI